MRSGIALAGANRLALRENGHDGMLWAAEASMLDLRDADLVVLASCSSGMADSLGSEGMFSAQRAMHAAGARSVVSTLWTVDNNATVALMKLFYRNLWVHGQSKAEALRSAKQALRDRFDITAGQLRDAGTDGPPAPTWIWAPFVLSGDWN